MTNLAEIIALLECGWHNARVLVVGDVMLDKYVWGEVRRISPEAPVPVVRAGFQEDKPGGAANVAMNLAGLGARITLVGFGGGDGEQATLESLLRKAGVEVSLRAVTAVPTTTKLRILCGGQQMMRLDREATPDFSEADYQALLKGALSALPYASVVVLSDYAKGALSEPFCRQIITAARERNVPVLVDPKNRSFSRYRGATAICPNLKELAVAMGEAAADLDQLLAIAQARLPCLEMEFMAVTLAEKGIAIVRRDSRRHAPAVVRQVYDVSGAGDTVIAVLALALACGAEVETAAQVANIAAGIVVSKVGTVPVQRAELLGALSQAVAPHMDDKVLHLDGLLRRVATWRSAGQRIVFTNGCFDILHVGHIRLLEQARQKGDRLIVGLNSDSSVHLLKGPLRPVVAENERARILAALSAVDAVLIFPESTPLRLIEAIRPDVLVKGGDYTEDLVVGAREVRAWGGRVELIPIVDGVSTTRLIARSAASTAPLTSPAVFSA
ncbi:MAG: bifunctional D-glycero-beta-D-manno-heptose-7-phosphate kinase/D-glycero-beta-D-manno-heptose 1-phosphate adenylyltransferase HldE [Candidatus Korobacteraceae bacterium]